MRDRRGAAWCFGVGNSRRSHVDDSKSKKKTRCCRDESLSYCTTSKQLRHYSFGERRPLELKLSMHMSQGVLGLLVPH